MSDVVKNGASVVGRVVIAVVLGMSVVLEVGLAKMVIEQGQTIAAMHAQTVVNTGRIEAIEQRGSPIIQAVMVRLDELAKSQARIEKQLEEHMKKP